MAFLKHILDRWQNLLHDEKLKHKIYDYFWRVTPMGKLFDVALIGFIVLSILGYCREYQELGCVIGPYLRVWSMFLLSFLR